jgi:hypothetical protein
MQTMDYEGAFGQSVAEPRRHVYAGLRPQAEVAIDGGRPSTLLCLQEALPDTQGSAARGKHRRNFPYVNQLQGEKE